eukprot:4328178-Pleurochrysis_carterae.AAC.5
MPTGADMAKLKLIIEAAAALAQKEMNNPSAKTASHVGENESIEQIVAPIKAAADGLAMALARIEQDEDATFRTVRELRPRRGISLAADNTIFEAAGKMKAANADAGLVVSDGFLVGILTDTDVARKVLADGLDANQACAVAFFNTKSGRPVAHATGPCFLRHDGEPDVCDALGKRHAGARE